MRYLTYLARFYLIRPWAMAVLLLLSIVAALLDAPLWLLLLILLLLLLLILFRRQITPNFYPQEEYLVPDQLILSGPTDAIDQLIDAANQQTSLQLEEVRNTSNERIRLTFGNLPKQILDCLSGCYDFVSQDFVIVLVRLAGNQPDVSRAIRILQQLASGGQIRVEPNWLTGSPWDIAGSPWDIAGSPWDIAGSPWDIAGSPWDIAGSPWDIGGSPWDIAGSSTNSDRKPALPDYFAEQWAFGTIELDGRSNTTGQKVRVGIFDTSPYPDQDVPLNSPETVTVQAPEPIQDWNLEVVHPKESAQLQSAIPEDKKLDVRDHGLFVAGLVNAVAPDANIRLCRVLGPDNRGDLFLLLREMFYFLLETVNPENQQATIINLSLGIRIPPDWVGTRLPKQVEMLQLMMQLAHCLNVTVVASAGNDSAQLSQPERANLPGLWPNVIGVAASNQQNGRACFSNRGDIAAPGGDGATVVKEGFLPVLQSGLRLFSANLRRRGQIIDQCRPTLDACADANCPTAVIGPVLQPVAFKNGGGSSNYIFWHGSSFAAPMVTGLAALVQQKGNWQLTPSQVRKIIECGAMPADDSALGAGIINVRQTMVRFEECAKALGIEVKKPLDDVQETYPKEESAS